MDTINIRAKLNSINGKMYKVKFIPDINEFMIESEGEETEYCPVLKVINEFPPKRFQIYTLFNGRADYGENAIYQVYVEPEKKRIGWIFPGQALLSDQHDFSNNPHFLKYAYVSIFQLLENKGCIDENVLSDKTFLVIDNDNTDEFDCFNINNYVVSLYSYGYTFKGQGNLYSSVDTVSDKHMHVKPVSKDLNDKITYIQYLFQEHIPLSENEVSSFLFFYQIVEILISIVFDEVFYEIINDIRNTVDIDLMQKKEQLIESLSEKRRIKRLFSNNVRVDRGKMDLLGNACDAILDKYNQEKADTNEMKLYALRCLLVHRCYILDSEGTELINDVNDILSAVIIDMLLSFKKN